MDNKDRLRHGAIAIFLLIWATAIIVCAASAFKDGDTFHIVAGIVSLLVGGGFIRKEALGIIDKK